MKGDEWTGPKRPNDQSPKRPNKQVSSLPAATSDLSDLSDRPYIHLIILIFHLSSLIFHFSSFIL